jgi:hypothetical protein
MLAGFELLYVFSLFLCVRTSLFWADKFCGKKEKKDLWQPLWLLILLVYYHDRKLAAVVHAWHALVKFTNKWRAWS